MNKTSLYAALMIAMMFVSCGSNSSKDSTEEDTYAEMNEDEAYDEANTSSYEFHTSQDVMAYLIGKRFYSEDYYIEVNTDGIYMNGQCMSLAPMITDFYESTAFIMANTPTNGRFRFSVDANNGTITDENSGDVYYLK